MRQIEKDIATVENIIRVLRRCLLIYVKERDYVRMIETMKDIMKCKKEIERLKKGEAEKWEKSQK
jgi:hypothetical protein